jgi:hypothetical protein
VKRTAEKLEDLAVIAQPSASRTTNRSALYPCWATIIRPLCGLINLPLCKAELGEILALDFSYLGCFRF